MQDLLTVEMLKQLAEKYIWWKSPEEALQIPDRIIAQVMNIGDYDDVQALLEQIGESRFRDVLVNAEIGMFNERSWSYWHYRLRLANLGEVPAMPTRKLA